MGEPGPHRLAGFPVRSGAGAVSLALVQEPQLPTNGIPEEVQFNLLDSGSSSCCAYLQ